MYNTLLNLSRNIFFYKNLSLKDSFETRIYLMLVHFAIIMIIFKRKNNKLNQKHYDFFFYNIENDLRESGFGDVSVNKKMKDLNRQLYDILLKIEKKGLDNFSINNNVILRYFSELEEENSPQYMEFQRYFVDFYNFCFELTLDNMIEELINFKFIYGRT